MVRVPWIVLVLVSAGVVSVSCVNDDFSALPQPGADGGASDGGEAGAISDGGTSGGEPLGEGGSGTTGMGGAAGSPEEPTTGGTAGATPAAAGAAGAAGADPEQVDGAEGGAAGSPPDGAGGAPDLEPEPDPEDPCADDPCNGRGACSVVDDEILCACDDNYFGPRCETRRFTPLGLPRPTDNKVQATAVSADGSVVVGFSQGAVTHPEAFRWENGAFTRLGVLAGGVQSKASAVSGDGRVVVGEADAPDSGGIALVGFSWAGGSMTGLGVLEFGTTSSASAVNEDGTIIVGTGDDDVEPAGIIWENGAIEKLASGFEPEHPAGITPDGNVIVGQSAQTAYFRVRDPELVGTMKPLDGATSCRATAVSANGTVAVGWCSMNGTPRAARWAVEDDAPAEDLGTLTGSGESRALATDETGTRIVGDANGEAVVWLDGTTPESLAAVLTAAGADLAGLEPAVATGISADGRTIVGYGQRGDRVEAFIARLP